MMREVVSTAPTNVEQPTMYRHTVYIQGAIGMLCVVGIVVLSVLGKQVDSGLSALGGMAVGSLATLLSPRASK